MTVVVLALATIALLSVGVAGVAGRRDRRWLAVGAALNAAIAMGAAYALEVLA